MSIMSASPEGRRRDIATMGAGFLWDAQFCEDVISKGQADMIALAREVLDDPQWALHAQATLSESAGYDSWPVESGWWLAKRARLVDKLGLRDHP